MYGKYVCSECQSTMFEYESDICAHCAYKNSLEYFDEISNSAPVVGSPEFLRES